MVDLIRSILNRIEKKTGLPAKHFVKFFLVGTSGIFVNMGLFFFLNEIINIYYKYSSIIAIECSIVSNFFLNYYWTWKDKERGKILKRLVNFHLIAFVAALINYITLIILVSNLEFNKYLANLIGIGLGFLVNFSFNHFWNFKK